MIIALQRAASTPSEQTKQNLYKTIEDLYRIYYEFIAEYYGTRTVSMETPDELKQLFQFAGQPVPSMVSAQFDFGFFKENPFLLKLDVGASTYYSEIASMQTLENMLMRGNITTIQFLERVSDDYVPKRRALIDELKAQQEMQMMQQMQPPLPGMETPPPAEEMGEKPQPKGMDNIIQNAVPELEGGKGNRALQRQIVKTGETQQFV